jgi:hypothetical protein
MKDREQLRERDNCSISCGRGANIARHRNDSFRAWFLTCLRNKAPRRRFDLHFGQRKDGRAVEHCAVAAV